MGSKKKKKKIAALGTTATALRFHTVSDRQTGGAARCFYAQPPVLRGIGDLVLWLCSRLRRRHRGGTGSDNLDN